jgi:hypothetical protein
MTPTRIFEIILAGGAAICIDAIMLAATGAALFAIVGYLRGLAREDGKN